MITTTHLDKYALGLSSSIHSTPLPDGTLFPEHLPYEDPRPMAFLKQFDRVRTKPWDQCTILDLGCNEGTSSFLLGQTGARILGIEGREDAVQRAEFVKRTLRFDHVEFRVGNVMEFSLWEEADAIYAAGILYHLEDPFGLLDALETHAKQAVYFCTHCAPANTTEQKQPISQRLQESPVKTSFRGKPMNVAHFEEPDDIREVQESFRRHPRSGLGNTVSVWLTQASLVQAMGAIGFRHHRRLGYEQRRLRYQLMFYKNRPRLLTPKHIPLSHPLPKRPNLQSAALTARQQDIAFLQSNPQPVVVVGTTAFRAPLLKDLHENDIQVAGQFWLTDETNATERQHLWDFLEQEKPAYIVLAVQQSEALYARIMLMNFAQYIFTSFSLCIAHHPPSLKTTP
jgi:trans-aconitate methyltransferase